MEYLDNIDWEEKTEEHIKNVNQVSLRHGLWCSKSGRCRTLKAMLDNHIMSVYNSEDIEPEDKAVVEEELKRRGLI